jgi:putative ABC transport system permease protein
MKRLATQPNGVLVAAETVKDFQLHPGDLINLRLLDGTTHKYKTVPFHYVGVAKEFPTAPTDSFLVANAGYVAKATGDPSIGTYLIQTSGASPGSVAQEVRHTLGTTALVTDIDHSRRIVGSNLTAVELGGLTRVELGFALVLALTASGIALGLGFRERRRAFAIARALGARGRHLGGFVWSEALFVTVGGLVVGTAAAALVADMLVKVLTGVFDPPPDTFAAPWGYLAAFVVVTGTATAVAGLATLRSLLRGSIEELRDL